MFLNSGVLKRRLVLRGDVHTNGIKLAGRHNTHSLDTTQQMAGFVTAMMGRRLRCSELIAGDELESGRGLVTAHSYGASGASHRRIQEPI